jgi:hypothetical protein
MRIKVFQNILEKSSIQRLKVYNILCLLSITIFVISLIYDGVLLGPAWWEILECVFFIILFSYFLRKIQKEIKLRDKA